jgi:acyl-lipid omega-6 desaturase (Delta-12 desaturase)
MNHYTPWSAQRKQVRALLAPFAAPSYARGLGLVALDLAFFAAASVAVVAAPGVIMKLVASALLGLALSRLFVLGHDACHQSLTPSRRLNAWAGRIVFMPTLTCFSLWQAGHNIAHHGFTGLRGRDIPWVPLSVEQYLALSRVRRLLYRAYRSWWGAGLYYGLDIWWKRQIYPKGNIRPAFRWDSWLVTAFLLLQVTAYGVAAHETQQPALLIVGLGVAVPYIIWLYMAGIVFYVHHTDETTRWYDDENEWRAAQPNLDGTHATHLPLRLDLLLHHALEHTAHHVNAAIPCYRLGAAQRALERQFPGQVPLRKISIRRYVEITRQCQLYDARRHQWLTFAEIEAAPMVAGVQ